MSYNQNTASPELSIVIPMYNESENIAKLYHELLTVLEQMNITYEIVFSDDGSKDDTFDKIKLLALNNPNVKGISLSRNFGHQIALTAGLQHAIGKSILCMDADLQHPPGLIPKFYQLYQDGYDIINSIREDTKDAGMFKKLTSYSFYKIINFMSDVSIVENAADFRLMNRKALDAYLQFTEKTRFTRGLISCLGFNQTYIKYEAAPRFAGKTKYTIEKMFHFANEGITSFSSKPLRLSFYVGIFASFLGVFYGTFAIIMYMKNYNVEGWTSILVSVIFLGGIQLITIGIMGEYIAKIFKEVKNRPLYFVKDYIQKQF
jgi:polyisoprenyl-phosphate glycosyltransferase